MLFFTKLPLLSRLTGRLIGCLQWHQLTAAKRRFGL